MMSPERLRITLFVAHDLATKANGVGHGAKDWNKAPPLDYNGHVAQGLVNILSVSSPPKPIQLGRKHHRPASSQPTPIQDPAPCPSVFAIYICHLSLLLGTLPPACVLPSSSKGRLASIPGPRSSRHARKTAVSATVRLLATENFTIRAASKDLWHLRSLALYATKRVITMATRYEQSSPRPMVVYGVSTEQVEHHRAAIVFLGDRRVFLREGPPQRCPFTAL